MLALLLFLVSAVVPVMGVGGGTASKPQMGWNSWNTFKANINQSIIETTAKALVDTGLAKAGYTYLVMDEGWQANERGPDGRQQFNATRFPSGGPALVQHIHDMGLKVGVYSDSGIYTCGFAPGSYGHEDLDAATYAAWGVDYLKYDNCGGFHAGTHTQQERFGAMSAALRAAAGRDVFYSLCQWGHQFPWYWADLVGAGSYRVAGDIHASFAEDKPGVCGTAYCLNTGYAGVSVLTMIRKMREISPFQDGRRKSWADMDMLEVGVGDMSVAEEETHFSFWAALKSPLVIGADVTTIRESSLRILLNEEIIAISQDSRGEAVRYLPELSTEGRVQVWAGPVEVGKYGHVVLALNYGNGTTDIEVPLDGIRLENECPGGVNVRDVWAAENLGAVEEGISLKGVEIGQTKVLLLSC